MATTTATRTQYGCPDWCERTDHHADDLSAGGAPIHYGPEFGAVTVQGGDGRPWEAHVDIGEQGAFVSDPDELRRVAAGMVRAAEWLEARR